MDPCPFLRLIVESLALKLPSPTKPPPLSGVHPSATPCFCKIRINTHTHTALLPLSDTTTTSAPAFHLDPGVKPLALTLTVSVYNGPMGRSCLVRGAKLLGRLHLKLDFPCTALSRSKTFHKGWFRLRSNTNKGSPQLHLLVRSQPDPRFVFQFAGEPQCSPLVFQIQANIRQPIFSSNFTNYRSPSLPSNMNGGRWRRCSRGVGEREGCRDRKGWMIMIHDLSGSPVAAASMVTPFVPSPGTDRVSRSNPGAWLILRPHGGSVSSWKPWGRVEAWRERGPVDGLGYRVELFSDKGPTNGVPIAEGTLSVKKGGKFCIDYNVMKEAGLGWRLPVQEGFVMASSVGGEGKVSKPVVQVGARHVTCLPDAALFIALSAAIDLSMDACMLFSHKLRKELSHRQQH
ncbi:hypothetical protein Fmac_003870 [Flemingia macrophylla]|uniref:Formin-like protein 18 n=1 Tax=Flemingia macrophylla TaxID=520843 RepID=A0ABD1N3A0_9FABA